MVILHLYLKCCILHAYFVNSLGTFIGERGTRRATTGEATELLQCATAILVYKSGDIVKHRRQDFIVVA